jgi:hypothetical protein
MASRSDVPKIAAMGTGATAVAASACCVVFTGAATGTSGAAALTSGLAALGSLVGGGMVVGIIGLAATPVAGGAVGYFIYRICKRDKDVATLEQC